MQRSRVSCKHGWRNGTAMLAGLLSFAPVSRASVDGSSVVTGVVRDAQGVAQMGVLVRVLLPGVGVVGSAFTDDHGRYTVAHLMPGRYRVSATANLFAPVSRTAVTSVHQAHTVVDLTMAALFDATSWLPAERRRSDEPADDWQWTLRSTANRPILRFDEDGSGSSSAVAAVEAARKTRVHGSIGVQRSSGQLGGEDTSTELALQGVFADGLTGSFYVVSGTSTSATDVVTAFERKQALGGGFRSSAEFLTNPGLRVANQPAGVQAVRFSSAEQAALGERCSLEAGSSVEAVHAGSTTSFAARPFVKLTALPGGRWKLQYRFSSSPETQEYADIGGDQDLSQAAHQQKAAWIGTDAHGTPRQEKGRHQEVTVAYEGAAAHIEVAYYHDDLEQMLLTGTGNTAPPGQGIDGLLTSRASGDFATLVNGYGSHGARVSLTAPFRDGVWIVAEYALGDAMSVPDQASANIASALQGLKAQNTQAGLLSVRGKVRGSGTEVRASYRWQPDQSVSAVDPYDAMSNQAFLSFFARQQVRMGSWVPAGLEATIEVSNLLAQGYRPFLSQDGHTLYLAQTPRSMQVGLAFNF